MEICGRKGIFGDIQFIFSYLGKIVFVAGGANGDPKATFVDATGDF